MKKISKEYSLKSLLTWDTVLVIAVLLCAFVIPVFPVSWGRTPTRIGFTLVFISGVMAMGKTELDDSLPGFGGIYYGMGIRNIRLGLYCSNIEVSEQPVFHYCHFLPDQGVLNHRYTDRKIRFSCSFRSRELS